MRRATGLQVLRQLLSGKVGVIGDWRRWDTTGELTSDASTAWVLLARGENRRANQACCSGAR